MEATWREGLARYVEAISDHCLRSSALLCCFYFSRWQSRGNGGFGTNRAVRFIGVGGIAGSM